jgi:hypothetical protein
MYEILKYSFYCDEAICLLNALCKTTHQMCYRHLGILVDDYLEKRVIMIKDRKQAEKFKDKRLAYFKVRFEMSGKFDFNHLTKFVKFFNELSEQSDLGKLTSCFKEMKIDKGKMKAKDKKEKFEVINMEAFEGKKLLNLHFIQQRPDTQYDLIKFINLFKRIEPDLFYSVYEKISISQINILGGNNYQFWGHSVGPSSNLTISQLTEWNKTSKRDSKGKKGKQQKNENTKNIIHYLIVNLTLPEIQEFYEKWEAKIVSLRLADPLNAEYFHHISRRGITGSTNGNNNLGEEEKSIDTEDLGTLVKSNSGLWDSLQFFFYQNKIDEEFLNKFFLLSSPNKMKNLKEFVCCCTNISKFKMLLNLFWRENYQVVRQNFEKMYKFGIYLSTPSDLIYLKEYVPPHQDYIKIVVGRHFIISKRTKEVVKSYAIKLKTDAEIYSGYIHHKYNDNMMSSNFIKFISIDPSNAYKTSETDDFLPQEELQNIKNHTAQYYNYGYHYQYGRYNSGMEFGDEFQIDIPKENVRLIEINRKVSLVLHTAIDTAACIKSDNPDLYVKLKLSWETFERTVDSVGCIEALSDDLIDELSIISNKGFTVAKPFIMEILNKSPNLKKLCIPNKITPIQYKQLEKAFSKLQNWEVEKIDDFS